MQTVTTLDGHEVRVVDEGDLLQAERQIRSWLIGIIGAILAAGLMVGRSHASISERTEQNSRRIEEIRQEGSLPLQALKGDIAVIKEQVRANNARQEDLLAAIERMERKIR